MHIKACLTKQAGLLDKQSNKKMALMASVDKDSDCIVHLITRLKEKWSGERVNIIIQSAFNTIDQEDFCNNGVV